MSKKNIDKLFREKLEDFHEIPDEKVWSHISESLDKKKSRKIIPFWWKLGGVAALVAVLFMVINPFQEDTSASPIISDTEQLEKEKPDINGKEVPFSEKSEEKIQLTETETIESNKSLHSNNKEAAVSNTVEKTNSLNGTTPFKNIQKEKSKFAAIDSEKEKHNETLNKSSETTLGSNGAIDNFDAGDTENIVAVMEDKGEDGKGISMEKRLTFEAVEEGLANVSEEEKEEVEEILIEENQKKSTFEEIEKKEDEEDALAENSNNKWSVGANLAPVYFGSFGEGSPIDPALAANSKSGDFNISYGLSVAYDVTDKLSVRTGVNKVDFGYDTNEVEFSASVQGSLSSRLNNVNYSESAENIVVGSKSGTNFDLANRSSDVISNDISRNGVMAQEFGYVEIPVELDYALVENRFGINLIGGVSTLFLTNNSVVLNDSNETIELGEANNLNNVNFSTNVGFGLNYKFSPKVRLNLEPVFKYQLGTFSETSGSFNPFSIGVYSGLHFKF